MQSQCRIVKPHPLLVIWEDAFTEGKRQKLNPALADKDRSIAFSIGWPIKETRTRLTLYGNLWTWHSHRLRIEEVEGKIIIPKGWILRRHAITLPKGILSYA